MVCILFQIQITKKKKHSTGLNYSHRIYLYTYTGKSTTPILCIVYIEYGLKCSYNNVQHQLVHPYTVHY